MGLDDHSVFISYRRDGGAEIARLLQAFLEQHGFRVFLDVDELDAGHFDAQLLRQIEQSDSFLMICSPGCLERCANPEDWVRREIAQAIRCRRQIIPIALPGFSWPSKSSLPPDIADLTQHNAFEYSHTHWRNASPRLLRMLHAHGSDGGDAPSGDPAVDRDEERLSHNGGSGIERAETPVGDRLAVWRAREFERALERTTAEERPKMIAEALAATKVLPESADARREVACQRASMALELGNAPLLAEFLADLMDPRVFNSPSDRQLGLIVKLERALTTGAAAREAGAQSPPHLSAPRSPTAGTVQGGQDGDGPPDLPDSSERGDHAKSATATDKSSALSFASRVETPPSRSVPYLIGRLLNEVGWGRSLLVSGMVLGLLGLLFFFSADSAYVAETKAFEAFRGLALSGLLLSLVGTSLITTDSRRQSGRRWLIGVWLAYLLLLSTAFLR